MSEAAYLTLRACFVVYKRSVSVSPDEMARTQATHSFSAHSSSTTTSPRRCLSPNLPFPPARSS